MSIPQFYRGQWVVSTDYGDIGYVEKADSREGPYEIRLILQWCESTLPVRSGIGFEPMTLPDLAMREAH